MRLRHAVTGFAAISAHAACGFAHDALYAATGDMVVEPRLIHWLANYGGYCMAGILAAMLALQLWIDWPTLSRDASKEADKL